VLITISIEQEDPPSGCAALMGDPGRRFVGWLDLLRVLSELVKAGRR
jgi:hypothetical protein